MQREYVAASANSWYAAARRALSPYLDDVSTDFGQDIYEKMATDPQIRACLAILIASILEDGLRLSPADAPEGNERKKKRATKLAQAISDQADAMLDDLPTPIDDTLRDMLSATYLGNRVAEQVYEVRDGLDGTPRLLLASLKPKSPASVAFVVDPFMNVLGLLAADPRAAGAGEVRAADVLPRAKFAILTWHPRNADPRGTSILRPAYSSWWKKQQIHVEYLKYLTQFAGPSLWAASGKEAQPVVPTAEERATFGLTEGELLTPEQWLLAGLRELRNGTALAVPHGTEVHALQMTGDGKPFITAIAEYNREITKAILTQELATEQGQYQARAAAEVHQDILDTLVHQARKVVARMVRRDILMPWVAANWGDDAVPLTPWVSLGEAESPDLASLWTAAASLGLPLHPSQYDGIDEMIGLPVRAVAVAPAPIVEPAPAPAPDEQPPLDDEVDEDADEEGDADAAA